MPAASITNGKRGGKAMNPNQRAESLVECLGLKPHPEGGWYRRGYLAAGSAENRPFSSAIYYLLKAGEKSRLHRIGQDEIWHFYDGAPLRLVMIAPDGKSCEVVLGPDILAGQLPQQVVPGGHWFAAKPACSANRPLAGFSLVGCTVAPAFDFGDFQMGKRDELLQHFPDCREIILEFT